MAQLSTENYSSITTLYKGQSNDKCINLLKQYIEITRPTQGFETPKHKIHHHIITLGRPCAERPRRLAPDKFKAAGEEFQLLIQQGICLFKSSSSEWASPLHMVSKKNGTWRMCGDYRKLNSQTIPDKYPIPHIHDFTHALDGR
ncbi:hypothetical protein QLX08_004362 [Tetragonisca angustula]|uniref:Uncharacterized protein n=1 Tax=Tetragonisca angustula TaxID=166442 RepID=A0AAW1A2Z3_9HYME